MTFGRLERTTAPQPMSEINMTPLVDVMLVLVVIFIITAPLLVQAIKLDLPQAPATTALNAPQFVAIDIDAQGQVFVNTVPIEPDRLVATLIAARQRGAGTEVRLRADAAVAYGRVVAVMGAAHQAGLQRIGFVAEPRTVTP